MTPDLIYTHPCDGFEARYYRDASHRLSLLLTPHGIASPLLSPPFDGTTDAEIESLLQLKCIGDDYPNGFSQGRTMRNASTVSTFCFRSQETQDDSDQNAVIKTVFDTADDLRAIHHVKSPYGKPYLYMSTRVENHSDKPVTLEMLSSFSLGHLSPFAPLDAPERLRIHRFRSNWSLEGRHESCFAEELQLERSWIGHGVACERFGQIGSMPVRGFFPFIAVEDTHAKTVWAAQLLWPGSWQIEVYRKDYGLSISGGLADREFGHWTKTLKPGESFQTPWAVLTAVKGDVDSACRNLLLSQQDALNFPTKEEEQSLPITFNEYCTTWGRPTHENISRNAECLKDLPVKYFVIDAGWYSPNAFDWGKNHGDWRPSPDKFPEGLVPTAQLLRKMGFVPGLWFEMETVGPKSDAASAGRHFLQRDGYVLKAGTRCFWDFRDPWVWDYLNTTMIRILKEGQFGYVKIDYNETLGFGVDGNESPGENLRQHIEKVQEFFAHIRQEIPEIVIENCSSGGHRLEPSMVTSTSLSSFSDAHETVEIPIIAANLQRLILPRQSLIWAVIRKSDSPQRMVYSLTATFLGRVCLSGAISEVNAAQMKIIDKACAFYQRICPVIREGNSFRFGPKILSYRHPKGWQGVVRYNTDATEALLVVHTFDAPIPDMISIPLANGKWCVSNVFSCSEPQISIEHNNCKLHMKEFQGIAVYLRTESVA